MTVPAPTYLSLSLRNSLLACQTTKEVLTGSAYTWRHLITRSSEPFSVAGKHAVAWSDGPADWRTAQRQHRMCVRRQLATSKEGKG